jgi:hypothetical protein
MTDIPVALRLAIVAVAGAVGCLLVIGLALFAGKHRR